MKVINYFLVVLVLISSCKEDTEESPILPNNYGSGLYIATDNGVSFYDGDTVKNQIYSGVNNTGLSNIEKIKFKGETAYILTENDLFTANIKTFEAKGGTGSFINSTDFEFVSPQNRIFVVDRGDSKVKVVDLDVMEITSDIETGDDTKPVSIVKNSYRSFVMNGGAVADSLKDSTIVAIEYRDNLVPLADMMGSLYIGDNPNSAVWVNSLGILCKGIYDENNMLNNTEASFSQVDVMDMTVDFSVFLPDIYNARNLISNSLGDQYFFIASDGIYQMSSTATNINRILLFASDILYYQDEEYSQYSVVDSTTYYYNRNVLYVNDSDNDKSMIYKYNLDTDEYIDTIIVDANVRDINFYE